MDNPTCEAATVTTGSGNVFADIGLSNPQEYLAKAQLASSICDLIQEQGLTQTEAGKRLGINQPKVSALMRGQLDGFSSDRLMRFINALGRDIEIVIKEPPSPLQDCKPSISVVMTYL